MILKCLLWNCCFLTLLYNIGGSPAALSLVLEVVLQHALELNHVYSFILARQDCDLVEHVKSVVSSSLHLRAMFVEDDQTPRRQANTLQTASVSSQTSQAPAPARRPGVGL